MRELTIFLIAFGSILGLRWVFQKLICVLDKLKFEEQILGNAPGAVFSGATNDRKKVFIKTKQRVMHTQVIGTTNAGKTESIILPWAIQDIFQGRGLVLIDGKADKGLLDKLYAYTVKAGREKDFRLFSLSHVEESHQFNPLIGGEPEEIAERVFNAFEFENPHFKSVQFDVFSQILRIFTESEVIPTFTRIYQCVRDPLILGSFSMKVHSESLKTWISHFLGLSQYDRDQRTSGLIAALSHFSFGKAETLFNTETPSITLDRALNENLIVYFQLPVLLSPFLGRATGKMVLQSLQSAIANRHRNFKRYPEFFSVFLDDFSEYLYPGFVSILNKSRSANIGVVFAHQALGDIKVLGDSVANAILTNSNLKIFMRGNDPESAEYFSQVIGTQKTIKLTERTKRSFFKEQNTGDASAREVDEFIVHPNLFKKEMGVGEAIMIVPHERGSRSARIKFRMFEDLEINDIPKIQKESSTLLSVIQKNENNHESKKIGNIVEKLSKKSQEAA